MDYNILKKKNLIELKEIADKMDIISTEKSTRKELLNEIPAVIESVFSPIENDNVRVVYDSYVDTISTPE